MEAAAPLAEFSRRVEGCRATRQFCAEGGVMRIGQHSAKVIFFASADAWIQAKPLIKLKELKNISTTFRRAQPENKSKLRDLISAKGHVLGERLVSQGGAHESTPKKRSQRLVSPMWAE